MYATCDGTHAVTFVCMGLDLNISSPELFTDQYVIYNACENVASFGKFIQ